MVEPQKTVDLTPPRASPHPLSHPRMDSEATESSNAANREQPNLPAASTPRGASKTNPQDPFVCLPPTPPLHHPPPTHIKSLEHRMVSKDHPEPVADMQHFKPRGRWEVVEPVGVRCYVVEGDADISTKKSGEAKKVVLVFSDEHGLTNPTLQLADLLAVHLPTALIILPDLLALSNQHIPDPTGPLSQPQSNLSRLTHLLKTSEGSHLTSFLTHLLPKFSSDSTTGHPTLTSWHLLGLSWGTQPALFAASHPMIASSSSSAKKGDHRTFKSLVLVDPLLDSFDPGEVLSVSGGMSKVEVLTTRSANTARVDALKGVLEGMGRVVEVEGGYAGFVGAQAEWKTEREKRTVMEVVREVAAVFED
ncbi:hypothetical protein HDV05_002283 [Chytridiales sp. JEL 0842]|nr:hypothetical protein HDV05_002283 [Chytridiales sp. JEL 0842]